MKVTLGQVRKLLREAQEGPDDDNELTELVDEMLMNLRETFGVSEIMDARWQRHRMDNVLEFTVTIGDVQEGHGNPRLRSNVVDAVKSTLTMVMGSSDVRDSSTSTGHIIVDDIVVYVHEDWDVVYDPAEDEDNEFHYVYVSVWRRA